MMKLFNFLINDMHSKKEIEKDHLQISDLSNEYKKQIIIYIRQTRILISTSQTNYMHTKDLKFDLAVSQQYYTYSSPSCRFREIRKKIKQIYDEEIGPF